MSQWVKITLELNVPFRYTLYDGNSTTPIKAAVSNNRVFWLYLPSDRIYQIVGDDTYCHVFSSNDNSVMVTARSTVAVCFTFAKLLGNNYILADQRRLQVAHALLGNLVGADTESDTKPISRSPNGVETNSYSLLNLVSNLVWYASIDAKARWGFLTITQTVTIVGAAVSLAKHPFDKIPEIREFAKVQPSMYQPTLGPTLPLSSWTLGLKVNSSGSINYLPGGPGNIAFDGKDRAWVSLNTLQNTPNSNSFAMVVGPDARPAKFSPPPGLVKGAGFGCVYSAAVDKVAISSFGWGDPRTNNPVVGAVTVFDGDTGEQVSPPGGYTADIHRSQGMAVDEVGNLYITSWGTQRELTLPGGRAARVGTSLDANSALVVYPRFHPEGRKVYEIEDGIRGKSPFYGPFSVAVHGRAIYLVNGGGGQKGEPPSSVMKLQLYPTGFVKECQNVAKTFEFWKDVVVKSSGEVFVANYLASKVMQFSDKLECLRCVDVSFPWGLWLSPREELWATNFMGPKAPDEFFVTNVTDMLAFTLPTAGAVVTLQTGEAVSDDNGNVTWNPLMRATKAVGDVSGALYITNNWKPFDMDAIGDAPGGDGLVVLLGTCDPATLGNSSASLVNTESCYNCFLSNCYLKFKRARVN